MPAVIELVLASSTSKRRFAFNERAFGLSLTLPGFFLDLLRLTTLRVQTSRDL